jgi:hypothetical protein
VIRLVIVCLLAGVLNASARASTSAQLHAAKTYVERVYGGIGRVDINWKDARYAPELAALLRRDAAASRGEAGALDAVPFCSCQDTARGYRILDIRVAPAGAAGARVSVLLRNFTTQRFVIDLIYSKRQWWISDVHSRDIPRLVGFLRRAVAREEAGRPASALQHR